MDIITLFLLCALATGSARSSGKFIYFFTKSSQECEQKNTALLSKIRIRISSTRGFEYTNGLGM